MSDPLPVISDDLHQKIQGMTITQIDETLLKYLTTDEFAEIQRDKQYHDKFKKYSETILNALL